MHAARFLQRLYSTESDGTLDWTPANGDAGSTHTVTITVNDGRGGSDSETFDIIVTAQSDVSLDTVLWNATITSGLDPDEGDRGWFQSGLGSIVHHTPAGNEFDLDGQTYAVTAVFESLQSSQYQIYINPAIPQQDRDSVHVVMGDLRCSFAAAEGSGRSPHWTYTAPTDTFVKAETRAAIVYNSNYLTLNGDRYSICGPGRAV